MNSSVQRFAERSQWYGLDDSIHYRFINELSYVEIALLREQFVFADIALGNARPLLLSAENAAEGKKLHQFKAYNTLSQAFLDRLEETYPRSRIYEDMHIAEKKLLALYLETVKDIIIAPLKTRKSLLEMSRPPVFLLKTGGFGNKGNE